MIPLIAATASYSFTAHPTNLHDAVASIFLLGAYMALFLLLLLIFSLSISIRFSNALFRVENSDLPKCLCATFLWMFLVTVFDFALKFGAPLVAPRVQENLGLAAAVLSLALAIKIVFRPRWFRALISGIVAFPLTCALFFAGCFGAVKALATFAPNAMGQ